MRLPNAFMTGIASGIAIFVSGCVPQHTITAFVCPTIGQNKAAGSLSPEPFPPAPHASSVPRVSDGRIILTTANFNQEVTVPKGTIVELALDNQSLGPWTVPQSSNPSAMPRLSASSRCVTPITAAFRATASAEIHAQRTNGEMTQEFKVSIQVIS